MAGHGLLELTTHSVERNAQAVKDFGIVRVVEILGGDPHWDQGSVTTDSLCHYPAAQPGSESADDHRLADHRG